MLGALSQRGHLRCLPLRYDFQFSSQDYSQLFDPSLQPSGSTSGKFAAPALPCFTSANPHASCPHSSVLSLCYLPPTQGRGLPTLFLCSRAR